jgi:hypothetical protein
MMEVGNPVSQLLGVFQGRADTFSDSVLAQPLERAAAATSKSSILRDLERRRFTKRDGLE